MTERGRGRYNQADSAGRRVFSAAGQRGENERSGAGLSGALIPPPEKAVVPRQNGLMKLTAPRSLNREEWLNYLHASGQPDDALRAQMEKAERMLLESVRPRGIYRVLPLAKIPLKGFSVRKHLEGCDQAAILAVTAGSEIDALIRRWQTAGMAMAVLLDTGSSVLAGQIADSAEAVLRAEIGERFPGRFFTPRFSPGYGDYPLSCQLDILTLVDAPRKIGLTLTAGEMMVPHKSITALIGLADHPVSGRLATCTECVLREKCTYYRTGGHC